MTSAINRTGKYSYNAVFSTGDSKQIKRGSRLFGAAYLGVVEFEDGKKQKWMGFARDKLLAERALYSETGFATGSKKSKYFRNSPNRKIGKLIHAEVIEIVPQHAV